MAGLTASGIGSGLDVNSLVSQLMTVEQRPLTALATKEASYQSKLSAFGQLKSALSTLQTAANTLKDAAKFSATRATVAGGAPFSATSTSEASAGNYSIEVQALAKEQRTATSATTEFAPAAGDLIVTFGKVDGGIFTPGTAAPKTLNFAGGTLEAFRDAINDGDLGISASIVNNGTVKQLVIKGDATGAEQAFQLSGTTGLSVDPTVAGVSSDPTYNLAGAQDAQVNVDGIIVTRSTNTLSDVLEGVTFTLNKEDVGTPYALTVADDKSSATSAINAFVKAYNDLSTTIKSLTAYDAENKQASTLTGDATARSMQSQLRNMLGGAISGLAGAARLSDIGVSFTATGGLEVNSSKLTEALSNPTLDVGTFFAGTDTVDGFATRISERIDGFIGAEGLIAGRTDGINSSIKSIDNQREQLTARLTRIEARYRAQFTALDTLLSGFTQTSNYLTQQLANLPGSSSSN
ncbi:flagellar filament capping protein FliD [Cognatazoarcus halotolerans]|uniref:flagellar filament capping protein FliD n=1 Tax=Cognatazoarcus halotolerans TaxID=2686016 RepID=UPI001358312B|nr:flagellar filament capping protein FliD [Cognatazoarcus halotolerans]MCB1901975.1 flagellar filament capping protein FliD [Rhodocyclaceae bacterium]MCP5310019.1 flagellar filament capping protein FliD [Zoogloeaceae bacterium]